MSSGDFLGIKVKRLNREGAKIAKVFNIFLLVSFAA